MATSLTLALDLSGTGITTSYQAGAAISAGRSQRAVVAGRAVTVGGSLATSAELRLEGSPNGSDAWEPLGVLDLTAAAPAVALEVTKATGPGATRGLACRLDGTLPYLRVAGKFSGAAGVAGESLSASLLLS